MTTKKKSSFTPAPDTVWLSRGRHLGHEPEQDVRRNLIALRAAGVLDDFVDLDPVEAARSSVLHPRDEDADPGPLARRQFEARWRVADDVTVRAQLTTYDIEARRKEGDGIVWVLAAEAERPWDLGWPSPATMFWPDSDRVGWDHDTIAGLRLRATNRLPKDPDELRHQVRDWARRSWFTHVVVHEAMTPDARGEQPITPFLPPSLRHRVIEHRASPEQSQIADAALKRELSVRMPRGGAVVLPTQPPLPGYDPERAAVSNVFLNGSEPSELIARIIEFATLPRPLPEDAEQALARLRKGWHLLTPDEELHHAQDMVGRYAEALEAMTKSRDAYKEAAEAAQSALNEARKGEGVSASLPLTPPGTRPDGSPLNALTKAFGRFRDPNK